MKKILALLLVLVMVLSLAACAAKSEPADDAAADTAASSDTPADETAEAPDEEPTDAPAESSKTYTVGVCQLVQHEALDAATQGFVDALTEALGDAVTIDVQNASGDSVNCGTIVNGFVSKGVDLIMANATPALTAAVSATADIPVLGTSITAYGVALDIEDFNGTVGGNVSGTSDLADLQAQAQMILDWFPETKTVGLLFCSAEPNSRYQIDEVRKALEEKGITCEEFAFTDSNDVSSVTQKAADSCDVVYIPTDNTAAANTEAIANVLIPAGVPAICGEEGLCRGCGVATLSISYYDLGVTTGKMAAKILTGKPTSLKCRSSTPTQRRSTMLPSASSSALPRWTAMRPSKADFFHHARRTAGSILQSGEHNHCLIPPLEDNPFLCLSMAGPSRKGEEL